MGVRAVPVMLQLLLLAQASVPQRCMAATCMVQAPQRRSLQFKQVIMQWMRARLGANCCRQCPTIYICMQTY